MPSDCSPWSPADDALKVLPDLLDARQPGSVQLAAIQSLAAHADPRVGPAIVAHWKAMGPAVRREAAEALFTRRERLTALLDGIEAKTIAASELDPARRKGLLVTPDRTLRAWSRVASLSGGAARPRGGHRPVPQGAWNSPASRPRGRRSSPRSAPPATGPKGPGLRSVPTWPP